MSADNYYIIRKHPEGGYTPVQGFASDDELPSVIPERHRSFPSIDEAIEFVIDDYTEYGIRVHPECKKTSSEAKL